MRIGHWLLGAAFLAACAADSPGSWTVDHVTTDGAILGVWGSGPHDVWAVGGQADRSLVLHGDGSSWTPVAVSTGVMLNNTYGFSATDVYAVGEHGLVMHYDGTSWTQVPSGTTLPLFGLWGASGDDVWIVGGDVSGPAGSAVVLRGAHGSFRPVQIPSELVPNVLFKAHGFAPDDVIMVGGGGAVLHWNGTAWSRDAMPTDQPLLSTWGGDAQDVYAVGGSEMGVIVHSDGQHWTRIAELMTGEGLTGVFTSANGPTIAVGPHELVELARDGSPVQAALPELAPGSFLHAVWGDGHGTTYSVGGTLDSYPSPMTGVILSRR